MKLLVPRIIFRSMLSHHSTDWRSYSQNYFVWNHLNWFYKRPTTIRHPNSRANLIATLHDNSFGDITLIRGIVINADWTTEQGFGVARVIFWFLARRENGATNKFHSGKARKVALCLESVKALLQSIIASRNLMITNTAVERLPIALRYFLIGQLYRGDCLQPSRISAR